LLVAGTKLTSRVGAVFTIIKVAIVVFVIVVGFFFIDAANYVPFIPESVPTEGGAADAWTQSLFAWLTGAAPAQYGIFGMLSAASLVFFAFIGFDVVATSAEEVREPQKRLPRGIFLGLAHRHRALRARLDRHDRHGVVHGACRRGDAVARHRLPTGRARTGRRR
jgi:APA family basic amino acid/polyamine antiporter